MKKYNDGILEAYEETLNERRPTKNDLNIKDVALALTGEIETLIINLLKNWEAEDSWNDAGFEMSKGDKVKTLNLAMKGIKVNKIKDYIK